MELNKATQAPKDGGAHNHQGIYANGKPPIRVVKRRSKKFDFGMTTFQFKVNKYKLLKINVCTELGATTYGLKTSTTEITQEEEDEFFMLPSLSSE